jgi:hypothetical protein
MKYEVRLTDYEDAVDLSSRSFLNGLGKGRPMKTLSLCLFHAPPISTSMMIKKGAEVTVLKTADAGESPNN